MADRQKLTLLFTSLLLITATTIGCGKPEPQNESPTTIPVLGGTATFGNHCPYGTFSQPTTAELTGWDCPGLGSIDLAEAPQTIFFTADCKKKIITVRSQDRLHDSAWEMMPNGSFSFTIDVGAIGLKRDSVTTSGCKSYTMAEFFGTVQCQDRDKAIIKADIIYWPGKGKRPNNATTNDAECKLPQGCYLYTHSDIQQCV
jgi:hypothetical protein